MTLQVPAPPRRFLPDDFAAGDLASVERMFGLLRERDIDTVEALEEWLRDESELLAHVDAELARRYVEMTRHTDSEEARESYLRAEREISPRVKVLKDELDRKLLAGPAAGRLDPGRYSVLLRSRRAAREIFRPENTALETEESELQTRQQALMGSLQVEFRGETHTLQQMGRYLEERDRTTRRDAYLATLEARRPTWPELEEILDALIRLRTEMARNAGFRDYVPYRFRQLQRFDYDAAACERLHRAIEEIVVPAVGRLDAERRTALGVESLRPWDLDVDVHGEEPLRPFEAEEQLIDIVSRTFARVDSRFEAEFGVLRDRQLLDLMSRRGKAPGGYQCTFEDVRLPFIFMNAVGLHRDVQTMLHEGGHAFHTMLSRDDPLLHYRDAPIEFAETASMSMELMGLEELAEAYGDDAARRARRSHLENVLRLLPWVASIDAFQLWMYSHPDHDRAQRVARWLDIRRRFGPGIDYREVEDALAFQWSSQPHLYNHALYYIEYGIAQIAALQVWQRYRRDKRSAVRAYREGLALGGSRPLPELFAAAGVGFDLSPGMLASLVADVEGVLQTDCAGA